MHEGLEAGILGSLSCFKDAKERHAEGEEKTRGKIVRWGVGWIQLSSESRL